MSRAETIRGKDCEHRSPLTVNSRHWDWLQAESVLLGSTALLLLACSGESTGPARGSVEIRASTTGVDLDPDGYTVAIDSGAGQPLAVNAAITFSQLNARNHSVILSGLAANCTIDGQNPTTVEVTSGGTAHVAFLISCTALTPAQLVSYGATGYRFKVLTDSTMPGGGFESPDFDDTRPEAGFSSGDAAFGFTPDHGCPMDQTVRTNWPVNTDLLLRKTFVLGAGARDVHVGLAIDNDVQVFVNGVDITAAGNGAPWEGFLRHDGCAILDSFVFTVRDEILRSGTNLVAVRARDRGGISFVDLRITAKLP